MKAVSFRALALASLASLAMATPGSAVTILQYTQVNPNDVKTVTAAGGVTTINTTGVGGSIPVNIGNIGGIPLTIAPGPNQIFQAFETYTGVVSTNAATLVGDQISQTFSGRISFTAAPGGSGFNYLTINFVGALLTGTQGDGSATFRASDPPLTEVVFTSDDARVNAAFAALGPAALRLENFAVGFSGIPQPPGFNITGTGTNATIAGFTAQNAGTFSATAVVPEPSGLAMAGTAMLASLGFIGWRRRQPSQA